MSGKGIDYFENSRRATYAQREYAIDNPQDFKRYGPFCWGITASDRPGPETLNINGAQRQFYAYIDRGAPSGPDDGTVAPWAVVATLSLDRNSVVEGTSVSVRVSLGGRRIIKKRNDVAIPDIKQLLRNSK